MRRILLNSRPQGTEPDTRYEFRTPGYFDEAQHRSMAGLVSNRQSYATAKIFALIELIIAAGIRMGIGNK